MTATILDANGAPVADQSVDWTFVTKQSASDTINTTPTATNAQGIATTTVTLGDTSGQRQIRATVKAAEGSTSGDVSASGVVTQVCGGLPQTSTLPGGCACRWRARRCRPAPGARGPCRRRAGSPALGLTPG